ncbi:MAG: hypothetical protein ACR2MX_06600 [Cyclobacteriaceae bacterium]
MTALVGKQLLETIELALSKQKAGATYADIRTELQQLSVPDDQISYIINKVDEQVLSEAAYKGDTSRAFQYMIFGAILCLAGVIIACATYFIDQVDSRIYIIAFAPFIGGYLIFRRAFHRYRSLRKED